jgi:ABC-2 type transport system ATP-binding protein
VIETEGLSKAFGNVQAVTDLTLRVPYGGVFGFLGPNGSGKTTTIGMLLGLIQPTSGRFRIFGNAGAGTQTLERIGAIVETPAFYPYLSGRANLRYFQGICGRGKPGEVDELLEQVGLSERANRKYTTYSQGMKQRLGIAYALLGDPEFIMLDEPTNGLDPAGMAEVREFIAGLGKSGRTIILSSHLLHEVEQVCDSVAILSRGRLIAQGKVKDLVNQRGGGVRLKATDNERAAKVLAGLGWLKNVRAENGYVVAGASPERSWEVTKALAEQGVYVTEMAPVTVSLEEYFLQVTEEKPA